METNNPGSSFLKVLFVASGNDKAEVSPIISAQGESLRKCGVNVEYFPISGKGLSSYAKALFGLRKLLRNKSFEIIHAHYGLSAVVAYAACRKTPLVVSFMGDDLLGSNRPGGKVIWLSRWVSRLNTFLARHCYDFTIVKSSEMLEKLKSNTRAEVIPNGVDTDTFRPLNRIEAIKGTGFKSTAGNFLFIGDPSRPEKNYDLARESAGKTGKDFKLHVIKNKIPTELCYYYNAADAVVITSYHEGSPNIVKEAMACNCPVVSTDVGDVRMLSEGVKGQFLTSYDTADVADSLISASIFRSEMGETTGRQRIIELKLDSASVANRIISIYKDCLLAK